MANIPMPRAPRGGNAGVRPNFLDLNVGDVGEGVARGVAELGRGIQQAAGNAEKYKAEADATAVQNAETVLMREVNRKVYEGEKAFLNQRGENAFAYHSDVVDSLGRERERVSSELANDAQRKAFARRSEAILSTTRRTIDGHLAKETIASQRESDKARLTEAVRTAANAYADEKQATLQAGLVDDFARIAGQREGDSDVVVREHRRRSAQAIHEARLGAALKANDFDVAERILATHGQDESGAALIDPIVAQRARDTIADARDKVANERTSMAIIAGARNKAGWVDSAKARALVEELEETRRIADGTGSPRDVARKQAVEADLARALAEDERKKAAAAEQLLNEATIILDRNGGNLSDKALAKVDAYFHTPENGYADRWTAMKKRVRAEHMAAFGADRASAAEARRIQQELDREAQARYEQVSNESPSKAADLPVDAVFGGASTTMREHLKALQAKDRKMVQGGGVAKWEAAKQLAWDAARPLYAKDKDKAAEFARWFRDWYDGRPNPGEPPTRNEVREAVGKALTLGDKSGGSMWNRNRRAWEVKPGEQWSPLPDADQDVPLAREVTGASRGAKAPKAEAPTGSAPDIELAPLKPLGPEPAPARPSKKAQIAAIRAAHPDWTPAQISAALR